MMSAMIKAIHTIEDHFDREAEEFTNDHPFTAYLTMMILTPMLILGTVAIATLMITLPLSWVFGW